MPKLTKQALDREIKKILSEIPADQVEEVNTLERMEIIYQTAYNQAWDDLSHLLGRGMKDVA